MSPSQTKVFKRKKLHKTQLRGYLYCQLVMYSGMIMF